MDMWSPCAVPRLETLAIRMCLEAEEGFSPAEAQYYQMDAPIFGSLHLQRLVHLKHVLISHLSPASLLLPPGAQLTLQGTLEMCARVYKNGWGESETLGQHMRALRVTTGEPYLQEEVPDEGEVSLDALSTAEQKLGHLLSTPYACLTHLKLFCSVGTAAEPVVLGPNLAALRILRMSCSVPGRGMHVKISRGIQPEAVSLDLIRGPLDLSIEDVRLFSRLIRVHVLYNKMLPGSASLAKLGRSMADTGKAVTRAHMPIAGGSMCHVFTYNPAGMDVLMLEAIEMPLQGQELPCSCAACGVCLQRMGLMHAM